MRRLLGEPEIPMPYKHPLIVSWLKVFGWKVSGTGKIFAGLGCPNGCDFCCTSHFFSRKHIKLLPTGRDIYNVVERYHDLDPSLVFLIIDEDFLLNKKRAMEFRECVLAGGKRLSIFAFSSIKAISQYKVEEILEMGIDGFWIGYEGTRSGYAKQQGRPVDEILTEFREHGITVLASMIVGFDYQTPEIVAQELDGLMKLKPSLGQYLIYGPVPGTPFHERVIKENLLQDIYTSDKDLFYRRADGFKTMMKHPTLSPAQIEDMQRWCFEQDFQRLGPSIYRVLETRFLGYLKLKDSPNPVLRQKAEYFANELRYAYPVFLAGRLLGPNATIRKWIGDLERRIHAELGQTAAQAAIQVRHGRGRGAVDGRHVEARSFSASEIAADDVSPAGKELERISICGKNSRRNIPSRTSPSRSNCSTRRSRSGCGWKARFRPRTRKDWASASAIHWRGARTGWCWT